MKQFKKCRKGEIKMNKTKKIVAIFLLVFIIGTLAGIFGYLNTKITTFDECETAGWLVRSITVYDGFGPIEKECTLWGGKHFVKQRTQEFTGDQKNDTTTTASNNSTSESLLILFSYHHGNTEKIAKAMAGVLGAQIKTPQQINPEELQEYRLIGFGSGIYDQKHHISVLDLADELPQVTNKKAFIFSTSGVARKFAPDADDPHTPLREILQSKGYVIVDEFNCAGWNTNSILKIFGGMNKGRPNAEDIKDAEEFAQNLQQTRSL